MGRRSGYDMTNLHPSPDPESDDSPRRTAGIGPVGPFATASQRDPKGKGKERATDAPSDPALPFGDEFISNEELPPVRRSADFREAVIEPFPELPPDHNRRRSAFGLDVGPRMYTPTKAGAGSGSRPLAYERRARPRALDLGAGAGRGSTSPDDDVEMGGTPAASSSPPGSSSGTTGSDHGFGDDEMPTPRASEFALPDRPPRMVLQSSQPVPRPQYGLYSAPNPYLAQNSNAHNQYGGLPPPPRILASQAGLYGLSNPNNGGNGGGSFIPQTQGQGSRQQRPSTFNYPASRANMGSSSSNPSFGNMGGTMAMGMQTANPGSMGYPPGMGPMSTTAAAPRTAIRPPPGYGPGLGFNTGPNAGFNTGFPPSGSNTGPNAGPGPRPHGRTFASFAAQELTQAEKDRRRKAALDAGFAELKAKRQKKNP